MSRMRVALPREWRGIVQCAPDRALLDWPITVGSSPILFWQSSDWKVANKAKQNARVVYMLVSLRVIIMLFTNQSGFACPQIFFSTVHCFAWHFCGALHSSLHAYDSDRWHENWAIITIGNVLLIFLQFIGKFHYWHIQLWLRKSWHLFHLALDGGTWFTTRDFEARSLQPPCYYAVKCSTGKCTRFSVACSLALSPSCIRDHNFWNDLHGN